MKKRISAVLFVFAVLVCRGPAFGFSFKYPFFEDPLRTRPPVLDKGVILPGDKAPITCAAPKDFSHPLAFDEAVDIALCYNPMIKSSWANIKVQAGALGEARSLYLPSATANLNRSHDRISYPDSPLLSTSDVWRNTFQAGVSWRLFDFGGRSANSKAAQNMLAAAVASHNAMLQKALADVTQAYFDAMTAKAVLKAAAQTEENARATLDSAKAREERGAISQSDRLRAATALANAELENNRAHGEYRKALAVLGQIMGVPGSTTILLPEEMTVEADGFSRDLTGWLAYAEKNHPAVISVREQLKAAENQVKVARSAGLPTLNFSGSYYRNTKPGEAITQTEARETVFGIGISIPIFEGFSSLYKIRGAEAKVEQRRADLTDMELRVALDLVRAYVSAEYALRNLDSSAKLLSTAEEAMKVSRRRYDKGAADMTEMLLTQSNLAVAERERIRSMAEWNSARLRLLTSAGRMGRSAVQTLQGGTGTDLKAVPVR